MLLAMIINSELFRQTDKCPQEKGMIGTYSKKQNKNISPKVYDILFHKHTCLSLGDPSEKSTGGNELRLQDHMRQKDDS